MNDKNIADLYEKSDFEKKTINISDLIGFRFDLFSTFLTSGAPETPYKNLSLKKLIDAMLDSNFPKLKDEE